VRALGLNRSLHPLPQVIRQQLRPRRNRRRRSAGPGCTTLTLRQRLLALLLAHTMTPSAARTAGRREPHSTEQHTIVNHSSQNGNCNRDYAEARRPGEAASEGMAGLYQDVLRASRRRR
jgi:hypothetical protein